MTVDIKKLEKEMTPQARPTTIPGQIIDQVVGGLAPTGIGLLNTAASFHPNYKSAGEMFEALTGTGTASSPSSTSSSSPQPTRTKAQQQGDRQFALNIAKDTKDTSALEGPSTSAPTFARGDFDRAGRAKGGVVSYKSISDMERGR
jgi:hypothetical protein